MFPWFVGVAWMIVGWRYVVFFAEKKELFSVRIRFGGEVGGV